MAKSVEKYILTFEPKYENKQYTVRFTPSNDVEVTEVNKYSDIPLNPKRNQPVKKNTLATIDKLTTPVIDLFGFFDRYIEPSIFRYNGMNLHKMFIGYKMNNRIYTLDYVLNNPELEAKTILVEGSTINDYAGKMQMINRLSDPDSEFLSYVYDSLKDRKTGVSCYTVDIATKLRNCKREMKGFYESDLSYEANMLEKKLFKSITSYKEYRGLFILQNNYTDMLEKKKIELEQAKQKLITNPNMFRMSHESDYGPQLTLFGLDYSDKNEGNKTK